MITEKDMAGWTDKDSKKPEYRDLYEKHDFIEAYSRHTDLRIEKDGPELAIGAKRDGKQDWDIHGKQQLAFLISRGMKPHHTLLDFGCGTGRLAILAAPYLFNGNYLGVDISQSAVSHADSLLTKSGYCGAVLLGDGTLDAAKTSAPFDFIWSHSVFTHIPMDVIQKIFADLSGIEFWEYCFTFKESGAPQRSGLKQFQYSPQSLIDAAHNYGLKAEKLPYEWPAGQKTMRVYK